MLLFIHDGGKTKIILGYRISIRVCFRSQTLFTALGEGLGLKYSSFYQGLCEVT